MTDRFEQKLLEWCNKSRTKDLEYLDLSQNQKPSLFEVASNIEVTHNRICLLSKAVLEHFSQLVEENKKLQKEVKQLRGTVLNLEKEVYNQKPLSKKEVIETVRHPRTIDIETSQTTQELLAEVKKIRKVVLEVKKLIGG